MGISKITAAIMRLFRGYDVSKIKDPIEGSIVQERCAEYLIAFDSSKHPIDQATLECAISVYGTDVRKINNTFHKSFKTVADADLGTLVHQQLLHYATTYGAEMFGCFDPDKVYMPLEGENVPELLEGLRLALIRPYTFEEIGEKIKQLVSQDIGLNKQTLTDLQLLIPEYLPRLTSAEVVTFTNRELKTWLYHERGIFPMQGEEFIRYCIYKASKGTLLINSKSVLGIIRRWAATEEGTTFLKKAITELNERELAGSFSRLQHFWLSMKTTSNREVKGFINRLKKNSKKWNRALPLNVMKNICTYGLDDEQIRKAAKRSSDVQLIRTWEYLLQQINMTSVTRVLSEDSGKNPRNYNIRNGSVWTAEGKCHSGILLLSRIKIINEEMKSRFKHLAGKKIYMPEHVVYPMYTSGKQTVGKIPVGTLISVPVDKLPENQNIVVGVHWYNGDPGNTAKEVEKRVYTYPVQQLDHAIQLLRRGIEPPGMSEEIIRQCNMRIAELNELELRKRDAFRVDLDLKFVMRKGAIGWDANYKSGNASCIFSGDITQPHPTHGAAEAILVRGQFVNDPISVSLNNYTKNKFDVPFDIFISYDDDKDFSLNVDQREGRGYVIDPNRILVKIPSVVEVDKAQYEIGTLLQTQDGFVFVLGGWNVGNDRSSRVSEIQNMRRQAVMNDFLYAPRLKDFLAIFEDVQIVETPEEADYDLSLESLQEDTFTQLLYPIEEVDVKVLEVEAAGVDVRVKRFCSFCGSEVVFDEEPDPDKVIRCDLCSKK